MSHEFYAEALIRSGYRDKKWYNDNILKVLAAHKEKRVRHIDETIAMAEELLKAYAVKKRPPVEVPLPNVKLSDQGSVMKPIEPEVLDILHGSREKGFGKRYLHERYKKLPENRFYYRVCSNWDYGWQQKRTRAVSHGRRYLLQNTLYRRNNVAPDPPSYSQPNATAAPCAAQYSCFFN